MLFITTVGLFSQGQKIQECGMPWVAAMIKWENRMKLKDAMFELRTVKTDKE
jgi:hypothetical protein